VKKFPTITVLTNAAALVFTNRNSVFTATQTLTYLGYRARSNRSTAPDPTWKTTIRQRTTYQWADSNKLRYFFNQGGFIRPELAVSTVYTTSDTTSTAWYNLITQSRTNFSSSGTFTWNQHTLLAPGAAATTLYLNTASGPSSTTIGVSVNVSKSADGTTLTMTAAFTKADSWAVDVMPSLEFFLVYSTDANGGTAAPLPTVQLIEPLTAAGNAYINLTADTIAPFSFRSYTNSTPVTVTVNSVGTFDCHLIDFSLIVYAGSVTGDLSIVSSTGFPSDVPFGNSAAFQVILTATVKGSFDAAFRIRSNSFSGDLIVPFTVTVLSRPFIVTPTPASVVKTLTRLSPEFQSIDLSANETGIISKTTSTFLTSTPGFSIESIEVPDFVDPNPSPLNVVRIRVKFKTASRTGSFSDTLRLYVDPEDTTQDRTQVDIPITYTMDVAPDQNLGTWKSAGNGVNGVIGFSYDLIEGVPTLTMGYGGGADGNPQVKNSGYNQPVPADLGIGADVMPDTGFPVYPYTNGAYSSFVNAYGVWITPGGGSSFGSLAVLLYVFNAPTNGRYEVSLSADNRAVMVVGNDENNKVSSENFSGDPATGVFTLSAGPHIIQISAANQAANIPFNPTAVAATIGLVGGAAVLWSTRDACRPAGTPAYRNWAEVYRIPLTLGAYTYKPGLYKVKLTDQAWGVNYGDYYEDSSMVTVTDDGTGNLEIKFLPEPLVLSQHGPTNETLFYARYLAYYYSDAEGPSARFNNLETKSADGATTFFLGFNRLGAVVNSRVKIPTYVDYLTAPSTTSKDGSWKYISDAWTYISVVRNVGILATGGVGALVSSYVVLGEVALVVTGKLLAGVSLGGALASGAVVAGAGTTLGAVLSIAAEIAAFVFSCFTGNTLVTMADGTTKRIDQVVVGDRVFNWNKTQINTVEFLEISPIMVNPTKMFYSPDEKIEPFATLDHPLYIDGQLTTVDPDHTFELYPWLGHLEQMKFVSTAVVENVHTVYNLWVDNDHTYIVNGFGTTSIIRDAATPILLAYEHGYVKTHEEAMEYFYRHSANGRDLRVGAYLFWSWLARLAPEIVEKFFVKIFFNLSIPNQDRINNFVMKPLGYSANSLYFRRKNKNA